MMKTKNQREAELLSSGLVDSIKSLFRNSSARIPEKYYLLLADYIDALGQLDYEGGFYLDPIQTAKTLPSVLTEIVESDLRNIHGRTDGTRITMNNSLDYEANKLYFFREVTHLIQTRWVDGHEECSFYNGDTGMFLTEGATQFTAEILYHVSNDTNIEYRNQPNTVRGHKEHTPYSPLSEYQLNGNILLLLSKSLGLPLNQILALGFRKNGRQLLKEMYEVFPENKGKFEEFMFDLEKIYSIDKLLIAGYENQLCGKKVNIKMQNGRQFLGNIETQGELINKIERELIANIIANYDTAYILQNYQSVADYLTTPQLREDFMHAVNELATLSNVYDVGPGSPKVS